MCLRIGEMLLALRLHMAAQRLHLAAEWLQFAAQGLSMAHAADMQKMLHLAGLAGQPG